MDCLVHGIQKQNRTVHVLQDWRVAQCCHKKSTCDTRHVVLAAWQLALLRGQHCSKLSSCGTRDGNEDSVKRSEDWYLHIWVNLFITMSPDITGAFQVCNSARVKSPTFLFLCFSFYFNHNYIKHIEKICRSNSNMETWATSFAVSHGPVFWLTCSEILFFPSHPEESLFALNAGTHCLLLSWQPNSAVSAEGYHSMFCYS